MPHSSQQPQALIHLTVNGEPHTLAVPAQATLLEALRTGLLLTGTKQGCDKGDCGACTVLAKDLGAPGRGEPILSCLTLAQDAQTLSITTIEGLGTGHGLDAVQLAFIDCGALQCGFCQPGMMLSARALLDKCPKPTLPQIQEALSGNLCRCTGYTKIIEAIQVAAGMRAPTLTLPVRSEPSAPGDQPQWKVEELEA